jgi:predicted ABC-type ATPase
MDKRIKRLRIFAGPNGSGKTSVYDYLLKINAFNMYYHINPDSIARDISVGFDFANWPFVFSERDLHNFFDNSPFRKLVPDIENEFIIYDGKIKLKNKNTENLTYLCAAIGAFLRKKMLESNSSFSYETVFSHSSKIDEIVDAKNAGFICYLYVVATEDAAVNLDRVKSRVLRGGHDVPEKKHWNATIERWKIFQMLTALRIEFIFLTTRNLQKTILFNILRKKKARHPRGGF